MGAKVAIWQALKLAEILPETIDIIHAHGTATRLNDQTEAAVIGTIFSDRPWVISTKGATGHTLGSSSALGVAVCLMALQQQVVPPCVGLRQPEFRLKFPRQGTPQALRYALCNGFGFGGQNGAIILGSENIRSEHPD
jgi:3-oxoacyl-[acyl-carrier-protein] synthase II